MSKLTQSTPIDDDEIDLLELFQTLWNKKVFIIFVTTCFVILAGIHSAKSPKLYKSEATFFIRSNSSSGSVSGYAAILGIGTPSNISSLINTVLNSYSIKRKIAKLYQPRFQSTINSAIQNNTLKNQPEYIESFIIGSLNLGTNFSFSSDQNNLVKLTYISTDKTLTRDILNTYLDLIIEYNKDLELSAEKNIITIVDEPRIPFSPFAPNHKKNIILGFILGIISSSGYVLIRSAFQSK